MATAISVIILAVILFLAIRYIYKEKRKGNQCIGCPYSGNCSRHHSGESCNADGMQRM